jgi:hypothetical protein
MLVSAAISICVDQRNGPSRVGHSLSAPCYGSRPAVACGPLPVQGIGMWHILRGFEVYTANEHMATEFALLRDVKDWCEYSNHLSRGVDIKIDVNISVGGMARSL